MQACVVALSLPHAALLSGPLPCADAGLLSSTVQLKRLCSAGADGARNDVLDLTFALPDAADLPTRRAVVAEAADGPGVVASDDIVRRIAVPGDAARTTRFTTCSLCDCTATAASVAALVEQENAPAGVSCRQEAVGRCGCLVILVLQLSPVAATPRRAVTVWFIVQASVARYKASRCHLCADSCASWSAHFLSRSLAVLWRVTTTRRFVPWRQHVAACVGHGSAPVTPTNVATRTVSVPRQPGP